MHRRIHLGLALLLAAAGSSCTRPEPAPRRAVLDAFGAARGARAARPSVPPELLMPGTRVHTEPRLGVPTFVWAAPGERPAAAPLAAERADFEAAARAHLERYAPAYGLDAAAVASARLKELHDTGRGGVIARFRREVNGVEVFREELKVLMSREMELVALSGYLVGDGPEAAEPPPFALGPPEAIAAAVRDFTGAAVAASAFRPSGRSRGGYAYYGLDEGAGLVLSQATRLKPVYFRLPDGLVPAYYLEVEGPSAGNGGTDYFSYVIAADDGRVLLRNNLTADAAYSYRVWADGPGGQFRPFDGPEGTSPTPNPTGLPDRFQAPFIPPSLVQLESGPIGTADPWLAPGSTETAGNNVEAYVDLSPPDGLSSGDFRAAVSQPGTFNYTMDFSRQPSAVGSDGSRSQQMAAITQLFYNVNFFHDWYYDSGFTELAGNAQTSNYGRGGIEGDSIKAEAQDFGGRDNANMSTPADGSRPRMQMYLFDGFSRSKVTVSAAPAPLAPGDHGPAGTATFGPSLFEIGAEVVRAVPSDGCTPLADATGRIVLIDRGTCARGFAQKAENAQAAGAVGAIIANVASSPSPGVSPAMGGTPNVPITIGLLSLDLATGDQFRAALAAGAVSATLSRPEVEVVDRDGALDNQIQAHEWGHYISNRLVGDANGLTSNLARGLGEGWADFHAMLLTVRAEDSAVPGNQQWQGVYALGGYATPAFSSPSNPYYFGVRRYPYSTDTAKDPLTYRHIANGEALPAGPPVNNVIALNGAPNSEVHNTGEIWATMLWECYAALLNSAPGRGLTFDQAQRRMKDILVAAYKLTPVNPTLLEARDAVLAAAYSFDPADYVLMATAFAKRGAGALAVAPDRFTDTNQGVVEDFTPPVGLALAGTSQADDISAPCGGDGILQAGESGHLTIHLRNLVAGTMPATTATLASSTPGVTVDTPSLSFPAAAPGALTSAMAGVTLGAVSGTRLDFTLALTGPLGAITIPFSALANYVVVPASSAVETVESPRAVWTVPQGSGWRRIEVSPTDHRWFGPDAPVPSDDQLWSPVLQVGSGDFGFTFRHRHQFEFAGVTFFDGGVIEISADNGATWTDVTSVGALSPGYGGTLALGSFNPIQGRAAFVGVSNGYPGFLTATVSLGTAFAGQAVRVRFHIGSDLNTNFTGWEIDDIGFTGIAGTPFDAVTEAPATCAPAATPPQAYAGPDQGVAPGDAVQLDGSGSSSPGAGPLTYRWSQIGGPRVALSDPGAVRPSFTAPTVTPASAQFATSASLTFSLTVSDGNATSAPSQVTVTVTNTDRAPVARAGPAQTVNPLAAVALDGSESYDADGDPIVAYTWTQTGGPPVTLANAAMAHPTFVAPAVSAVDAVCTFQLVVSDAQARSAPAMVEITVHDPGSAGGCGAVPGERGPAAPALLVLAGLILSRRRSRPEGERRRRG